MALIAIVQATPLPVQIVNGPDAWAESATIAAVVAALVASITLFAVLRQIKLANSSLAVAQEELQLVRDDLRLSQEMARIATTQAQEAQKKPELALVWDNVSEIKAIQRIRYEGQMTTANTMANETLFVLNRGERTSPHCSVQLFIPATATMQVPEGFQRRTMFGNEIYFRSYRVQQPIYKEEPLTVGGITFPISYELKNGEQINISYQIRDDYDIYPAQEPGKVVYGALFLQVMDVMH